MSEPLKIEIYSDTICPWCYIGKRRFERALAGGSTAVQVQWMPFQLNPDMPREGMDRQTYLETKFGGAQSAEQVYAPVRAAGREEAIEFAFERMVRTPNTLNSHRLIHYGKRLQRQDEVVQALFEAYFERGEDIGDIDVLSEIAAAAGLDPTVIEPYLRGDDDRAEVQAHDGMARRMGIQGVPFFVIDRRYAVSGAQPPETFLQVFQTLAEETDQTKT